MTGFFDITESYPNCFKGYEYNHETKEITEYYFHKYKTNYKRLYLGAYDEKILNLDHTKPQHLFIETNQKDVYYCFNYSYNKDLKQIKYFLDGVLIFNGDNFTIQWADYPKSKEITKEEYLKLIHLNAIITEADYD